MIKLEKYTGEKTYMFPNGAIATKEAVLENYPAAEVFTFVVGTDELGQVMQSMDNLSVLRGVYGIDSTLSEDEAIAAIETILNTPKEAVEEVTAEERIAACMEYQMLTSMEDTEEVV
ncbi:MAG: hypothetical protein E7485_10095 [Ruminococcaceae bacterium]|nr:hypothetical protein [Oscillospiraceae bacterium]